jgi:hypothetical protein
MTTDRRSTPDWLSSTKVVTCTTSTRRPVTAAARWTYWSMNRHRWMWVPAVRLPGRGECSQGGRQRQRGERDEPGSAGDVPERHATPASAMGQAAV